MKQLFLPLSLLVAMIAAFQLPATGIFLANNYGPKVLVFLIFLVSGYQTGSKGLPLDRKLFILFLVTAVISLLLAPLLGLAASLVMDYPLHLAMGIVIISTVPPTISSGVVITEVSRGNAVLALFLTISLNLLGILSMPFILDLALKATGPVDIDQTALLLKMLLFVLLPFVIGKAGRNISGRTRISVLWSYVNSGCVAVIVYCSVASSRSAFTGLTLSDYGQILIGVAAVHILLLLITWQAGKRLQLDAADNKAMLFVTSQKTLAIALAVLANISIDTGNAIIVCLMFHFFQLFADSLIAARMRKQ